MRPSIAARWRADRDYHRACRLAREGRPGEAVKAFDRVLATFPQHARAHLQRALALAAAGRTAEAVRAGRQAASLDPRNHAPHLFLGVIHLDADHPEEARKAFAAAARLDPENGLVQGYLALAQLAAGRTGPAVEALRRQLPYANEGLEGRALVAAETFLWEHREQARPLEDQLSPEEGGRDDRPPGLGLRVASLVRRAMLAPVAAMRGRRARLCLAAEEAMALGQAEAAASALRAAGEAGTNPEWVALSLAEAYLRLRRPEAALEQLNSLAEETRDDPVVAALHGDALIQAGRYVEARQPLEAAAEHFRREFAPCYYRGLCEIALGQPQLARPWFIGACERLNPNIAARRLEEMARVWRKITGA